MPVGTPLAQSLRIVGTMAPPIPVAVSTHIPDSYRDALRIPHIIYLSSNDSRSIYQRLQSLDHVSTHLLIVSADLAASPNEGTLGTSHAPWLPPSCEASPFQLQALCLNLVRAIALGRRGANDGIPGHLGIEVGLSGLLESLRLETSPT